MGCIWCSSDGGECDGVAGFVFQAIREVGAADQIELPSVTVITEAKELVEGDSCI